MRPLRRALALLAVVLFWNVCAASPAGAQTCSVIHSFENDLGQPQAGLVFGDDGVLYGTTQWGGSYGYGSVYTLTPDGVGGYTFATLYSFPGDEGVGPAAALLRGSDGMFYGSTAQGFPANEGTLFRIDAAGTLTTLHVFLGPDGGQPMAALAEGRAASSTARRPVAPTSATAPSSRSIFRGRTSRSCTRSPGGGRAGPRWSRRGRRFPLRHDLRGRAGQRARVPDGFRRSDHAAARPDQRRGAAARRESRLRI